MKTYKLMDGSGTIVESEVPGALGGNSKAGIYGRLDCSAANRALSQGYAQHRVFFADETAAIEAGYRPCGSCLRDRYSEWKAGPEGAGSCPWKKMPVK